MVMESQPRAPRSLVYGVKLNGGLPCVWLTRANTANRWHHGLTILCLFQLLSYIYLLHRFEDNFFEFFIPLYSIMEVEVNPNEDTEW